MLMLSASGKMLLGVMMTVALTTACVLGGIWVTHTQSAEVGNARARCQAKKRTNHTVFIHDDKAIPERTVAEICDTLTITNQDNQTRLLAFGPHDHHVSYDGVSEQLLNQNQSFSITLIQPGNFIFHDHLQDDVAGSFVVTGTQGHN